MTVFGPDVSQYQKGLVPPDPHGIGFGITRASIGQMIDTTALTAIKWYRDHDIPTAAYHYVYPVNSHPAKTQAVAFHEGVGADSSVNCMIDWERDNDDNCHPPGQPQVPTWADVLAVTTEIRNLGHKVKLIYAPDWYWAEQGKPNMAGSGFDLVSAEYGAKPWPTGSASQVYQARGGDASADWKAYGGLTPVLLQFSCQVTWGNKALDMNAYRGDPAVLGNWFTLWNKETTVATTYPDGYNSPPTQRTIEEVFARSSVKMLHPEFKNRWQALMIASEGKLGIGGAGRSTAQQQAVFLDRHYTVTSGGCCIWQGKRYQLKKGAAHAAPPLRSFHENIVQGWSAAVDAVGDLKWAALNCERFGLEQATWGGEVWHFQFTEFPHSVSAWIKAGSPPPQKWVLPAPPTTTPPPVTTPPPITTPPPTTNWATDLMNKMPVLKKGAQGVPVKRMQHFLALSGQMDPANMGNFDGVFGSGTESALNRFLATKGAQQDGVCDRDCWDWFMEAGNGIPNLVKGNTGMDVQRMQRMLSANGQMDPSNRANFDGVFGSGTESALKKFQTAKGLTADGQCGQKTWTSLLNG
jgi:peptidoglycan hydrolase-like protein with peptidoglycan-binding domain